MSGLSCHVFWNNLVESTPSHHFHFRFICNLMVPSKPLSLSWLCQFFELKRCMDFSPRPRCVVPTPLMHLDFRIIYRKNKYYYSVCSFIHYPVIVYLCHFFYNTPILENEFQISYWLLSIQYISLLLCIHFRNKSKKKTGRRNMKFKYSIVCLIMPPFCNWKKGWHEDLQ